MTIIDLDFARDPRGCESSIELGAPVHPVQMDSCTVASSIKDNRRSLRQKRFLANIGNLLSPPQLRNSIFALKSPAGDVACQGAPETSVVPAQALDLDHDDQTRLLEALLARLDDSLETYAQVEPAAPASGTANAIVAELASIARVMLESTRRITEEMSRKELQTRALQSSLADARRSAEIDFLTGLPNRRAFEAFFKTEHAAAIARGESLCVAFVDLDHFKRVNDTFGHAAGDRVLKVVAQLLAAISDDKCHVARHGGEEFVVLFRGKSLSEACAELDMAREALAGSMLANRADDLPTGEITFSGGIADVMAHATTGDALKAADGALYAAKTAGRNRIALASSHPVHHRAAA